MTIPFEQSIFPWFFGLWNYTHCTGSELWTKSWVIALVTALPPCAILENSMVSLILCYLYYLLTAQCRDKSRQSHRGCRRACSHIAAWVKGGRMEDICPCNKPTPGMHHFYSKYMVSLSCSTKALKAFLQNFTRNARSAAALGIRRSDFRQCNICQAFHTLNQGGLD